MVQRLRRILPLAAAVALLGLAPARAEAGSAFGLGLHDWLNNSTLVQAEAVVDTPLFNFLDAGVRGGVLYEFKTVDLGIPIDGFLRLKVQPIYIDALVGPWIVFRSGKLLNLHEAIGVGYLGDTFSIGIQAGGLNNSPIVGIVADFRL